MIEQIPTPIWRPILREGTTGVTSRVLLKRNGIAVVQLKFEPGSTIDEHSAPIEIDVICVGGSGFVSIGGNSTPFRTGERVVWLAAINHRLWTEDAAMETLMIERLGDMA